MRNDCPQTISSRRVIRHYAILHVHRSLIHNAPALAGEAAIAEERAIVDRDRADVVNAATWAVLGSIAGQGAVGYGDASGRTDEDPAATL